MSDIPSHFNPASKIAKAWNAPLSAVASVAPTTFSEPEVERHTIYSLLLMSLTFAYWNGNKNGARDGEYPWREKQRRADGSYAGDYLGDRYIGHNIAAIAVDSAGRVVDFDFNHNKIFNSSVQHAEARLIRRLFGLAAVHETWDFTGEKKKYRTELRDTTIYTTLESCAQCAGIMALANLPRVFYLQPDPGQYMVAQLLRNLSDVPVASHIPAEAFGLQAYADLTRGMKKFESEVSQHKPFYRSADGAYRDTSRAVTSFLCTDLAAEIYERANRSFIAFQPRFADFQPENSATKEKAMSNSDVLARAREFHSYVVQAGLRGTPHFN